MKGLFAWIGFSQLSVPYPRDPRHAGRSKWSYWKLWNLAIEGLTSFTIAPLRLASYPGAAVVLLSFAYAAVIIYKTLAYADPVRGYPSLIVTILFLGGAQLLSLGVIGEYLGRIFNEMKRRPVYLVNRYLPAAEPRPGVSIAIE
jgi:glycosyltransferase involved in cell wall biosynthesis